VDSQVKETLTLENGISGAIEEFYSKNYMAIYKIFLDSLQELDKLSKQKNKGKKPMQVSDVNTIISILNALFKYSSKVVGKKWQYRSILMHLEMLLDLNNDFKIRKSGFDLLQTFIDIMQENADEVAIDLFLSLLDFKVYASNKIKLPQFKVRGK
jgi:hypothetical protein